MPDKGEIARTHERPMPKFWEIGKVVVGTLCALEGVNLLFGPDKLTGLILTGAGAVVAKDGVNELRTRSGQQGSNTVE